MKCNYVAMGSYYQANPYGMVRTICRATDFNSGEAIIIYVNILNGGFASETFAMPEVEFKNIFLN